MTSPAHRHARPRYALYLAVLPFYRQACIEALHHILSQSLTIYTGSEHLDATVTTGITTETYTPVSNRFLFHRRAMLQLGHWRQALGVDTLIVDLNPRNITSWIFTILRKMLRRRTLVWGHLYPRQGPGSRTDWLRRLLRKLSNGTILYGYTTVVAALSDLPRQSVWVAPNSIYSRTELDQVQLSAARTAVMYVGRLVSDKKVSVLVEAFALTRCRCEGAILRIVGAGDQSDVLHELAHRVGCDDQTQFLGPITDVSQIRDLYSETFVTVSPGYAGLSLTQSLGFGVPVLVSRTEQHSPEIELDRYGHVSYFETDSAEHLAQLIDAAWTQRCNASTESVAMPIRALYSAEAMAEGLAAALRNIPMPATDEEQSPWTRN